MGTFITNPILRTISVVLIITGLTACENKSTDPAARYQNYVEVTTEGWPEEERIQLYQYINENEPRITLVPDLPGYGESADENELIDPAYFVEDPTHSYGLKGEYVFTTDWFSRKSPAWEVALKDFAGKPDVQYLEVGVYEGRSVVWMLENILTHPTSHVTGIDIFWAADSEEYVYSPEKQKLYEDNVISAGGDGRFTTLATFSQVALRDLPLNFYDVIYIDGAHNGPAVLEDAVLSMRLLKEGGVLIFDDYRWWPTAERIKTPRYAIDIFMEAFSKKFEVIHSESQVILVRKKTDLIN